MGLWRTVFWSCSPRHVEVNRCWLYCLNGQPISGRPRSFQLRRFHSTFQWHQKNMNNITEPFQPNTAGFWGYPKPNQSRPPGWQKPFWPPHPLARMKRDPRRCTRMSSGGCWSRAGRRRTSSSAGEVGRSSWDDVESGVWFGWSFDGGIYLTWG